MTDYKALGPRIRALRHSRGMSMDEVATLSRESKSTISRFERGMDTYFSAVVAICGVLGLDFNAPECNHQYACIFCGEASEEEK